MKIIMGARRSGKTRALIEIAIREGAYIVCARNNIKNIMQIAQGLGVNLDSSRFITFSSLKKGSLLGKNNPRIVIDDIESLLHEITTGYIEIRAITINSEEGEVFFKKQESGK